MSQHALVGPRAKSNAQAGTHVFSVTRALAETYMSPLVLSERGRLSGSRSVSV